MYLVEDIAEARLRYEAMGFEPKLTDDKGCIGVSAGPTNVILLDRDYAKRTLPERAVRLLEERPALYIWVESLEESRPGLRGVLLGETNLAGLREWAIESDIGLMVLAETRLAH
jgi:hypothetical protein